MKEVLGEGNHIRLVRDENGWEWAERTNSTEVVAILAITQENTVLFVEQSRPPVGGNVIELPAGLVGDEGNDGEAVVVSAARELEEETGYRADEITVLTSGPLASGLTDGKLSIVLASELTKVGEGGGVGDENIIVHEIPATEILSWLEQQEKEGKQVDTKIYAALFFVV